MKEALEFKVLDPSYTSQIIALGQQLNPEISLAELHRFQTEMFQMANYHCFGLLHQGRLVGISSGWITVRYYSGKQLEVDNVIVESQSQSRGWGSTFFTYIEAWAKENACQTIELNTYVQNSRSHKFYYNLGYKTLGFHMQKNLG